MALNTEIDSLDAGAPELRLEGEQQAGGPYNTGSDVKNALNVWNNMGPQDRAEFDGFLDFFRSGAWRDQIHGMRQMQQQRKTAAQGGRMGFQEGALDAYQGGQNIMGPYDVSEYEASGKYSPGDLDFLSRTQIPTEAPEWYTQEQERYKQHHDPTLGPFEPQSWEEMEEGAKVHMMRELGPYYEQEFTNPNARMMPPVGPVPLAGMDPSMMAGQFDPSMITTPRDNQYNVAQWNKETMLRKGVDPRMFASYGGTARPTYTQSRKQRINAAGGGIMGSNAGSMLVAPTADGSRPGYGILSSITKPFKKIIKKVKEDIIPNELKTIAASPVGKAALLYAGTGALGSLGAGGGLGSLINPATYAPSKILGNLGTSIGNIGTGAQNLLTKGTTAAKNLMNIGGGGGTGIDAAVKQMTGGGINPFEATGNLPGGAYNPFSNPFLVSGAAGGTRLPQVISKGPMGDDMWSGTTQQQPSFLKKLGQTLWPGGEKGFFDLYGGGGGGGKTSDGQGVNWQLPVGMGVAAGLAQSQMPKDVIPTDTSGYAGGVGEIQRQARITPEALAATKGLHFVPQDVARLRSPAEEQAILGAAEGGRIGYNRGRVVNPGGYAGDYDDPEYKGWKKIYETNPELAAQHDFQDEYLDTYEMEKARGKAEEIGGSYWPFLGIGEGGKEAGASMVQKLQEYKYGNKSQEDLISDMENMWQEKIDSGYNPGNTSFFGDVGITDKDQIREKIEEGWDQAKLGGDTGIATAAQGGRIGYNDGGGSRSPGLQDFSQDLLGQDVKDLTDDEYKWLKSMMSETMAQGGRIGYADGTSLEKQATAMVEAGIARDMNEAINMLLRQRTMPEFPRTQSPAWPGGREFLSEDIGNWKLAEGLSEAEKKDTKQMLSELPFYAGGRVAAQEGGLMNLGGMEKDYRQEGRFVPIGGQEKADDVPARLSKNEFVFTADAVRAAGGGDIDAGAEVMENVMKNLEAGGKVSEESQGLEGARNMFATSQRLQNRII